MNLLDHLGTLTPERKEFVLSWLPTHLCEIHDEKRLEALLTDLAFIAAKCATRDGVFRLQQDYWTALSVHASEVPRASDTGHIHAFATFLASETHRLARFGRFPAFCVQQAVAYAGDERVRASAKRASSLVGSDVLAIQLGDDTDASAMPDENRVLVDPLRRTLQGHIGFVLGVDVSADGNTAVSVSYDQTLRIWDLNTGQCRHSLYARSVRRPGEALNEMVRRILLEPPASLNCISLSPDGRFAMSGDKDGALHLWDVGAGNLVCEYNGHDAFVYSVCLSLDAARAVSGGQDRTVRLWDVGGRRCLGILEGHSDAVVDIDVDEHMHVAISASKDGTLRVWDLQAGTCSHVLTGHEGAVRAVRLARAGTMALSAGDDAALRIWDVATGVCMGVLPGHEAAVYSLALTPSGHRALSGGADNTVRVWDIIRGRCQQVLDGHTGTIRCVCVTPDGTRALSGSFDTTVRVWNLQDDPPRSGVPNRVPTASRGDLRSVELSADGCVAVTGGDDGIVRVWDFVTGRLSREFSGHRSGIRSLSLTPDGAALVSGSADGHLRLWSLRDGQCWRSIPVSSQMVQATAISPDGKTAIVGTGSLISTDQSAVWLVDLAGQNQSRPIGEAEDISSTWAVAFTADGCVVASGDFDGTIRLWDVDTGQLLREIATGVHWVQSLAISPDGRILLSGHADTTMRLWDIPTGTQLSRLRGHEGGVTAIQFSPDGEIAVSAGFDRTIRIWDLAKGECSGRLCISATPYGLSRLAVGDSISVATFGGGLIRLRLSNVHAAVPFATPVRIWRHTAEGGDWDADVTVQCVHCGGRFLPEARILAAARTLREAAILTNELPPPCLALPEDAVHEPCLPMACPSCGGTLRINPFVVDRRTDSPTTL